MTSDSTNLIARVENLRPWLIMLARLQLEPQLRQQDASNIAQEVLLDVARYRETINDLNDHQLRAWARKVVRHKVADLYRKQKPMISETDLVAHFTHVDESCYRLDQLAFAAHDSPSRTTERAEAIDRLAGAIQRLPEMNREVVLLKDISGWKLTEIADQLQCPISVVAGRLRRGREQLLKELGSDE